MSYQIERVENCENHEFGCLMISLNLENSEQLKTIIEKHDLTFEDYPHITLLYGFIETEKQIDTILKIINNFKVPTNVEFNNIDIFGKDEKCLVLKSNVGIFSIYYLNSVLQSKTNFKKSPFSFNPHCTLTYGNSEKLEMVKNELKNLKLTATFKNEFVLSTDGNQRFIITNK